MMSPSLLFGRREVLGAVSSLAILATAAPADTAPDLPAVRPLPDRGKLLIRGGYVLPIEGDDIPGGDVAINGNLIVGVGKQLELPGAQVIDAAGYIVMPGLVDTHWHMWCTLLRNMAGTDRKHGYFPMTATLGKAYQPEDMYLGALLAAAEAIHSGITTVHDWCHNVMDPAYARADLRALEESGLRGRFSYGVARRTTNDQTTDLTDLAALHRDWAQHDPDGRLTLGLAWRGVQYALPTASKWEVRPMPEQVWRAEYDAARKLDLPITVHANSWAPDRGHIAAMQKFGILFDRLQVVHGISATPEEMSALAEAGGSVSMSPASELRIGYGMSQLNEWIASGALVTLSVDTTPLTGNADMFGIMKLAENIANGTAQDEFKLTPRQIIRMATLDGAKGLGIADRTGSLVIGKRADVIMIDTQAINMMPFTDAAHAVVNSAQGWNVDTVVSDGRVLKRGGKLVALDPVKLGAAAAAANRAVVTRAGWA
jgi:cytosine/adenosine deaminase-related metal-dependent hydrolase